MTDIIGVDVDEIRGHANAVENVADRHHGFEVDTAGTDSQSTGHVELSENLPEFAAFLNDVVAVLTENAGLTADALRAAAQDLCINEEQTRDQIRSLSLPSFDGRGQDPQ